MPKRKQCFNANGIPVVLGSYVPSSKTGNMSLNHSSNDQLIAYAITKKQQQEVDERMGIRLADNHRRKTSRHGEGMVLRIFAISLLAAFMSIYSGMHNNVVPAAVDYFDFDMASEMIQSKSNNLWDSVESAVVYSTESSTRPGIGLPTLEELTSANYSCPEGTEFFENIVLPESITHANRKIPKVVHLTAKSRCVTPHLKSHILKWQFPDHSLYFHDDIATYKLLQYAIKDANGYELVHGLSKAVMCISSGATMSDLWRYILLFHYGGIYTDLDNAPGKWYDVEHMTPETDSFYYVDRIGIMSQYYMVSSKHHPVLLYMLSHAVQKLYNRSLNVMRNNPPFKTGPDAVRNGFVYFMRTVGSNTNGYLPAGTYYGGVNASYTSMLLPWFGKKDLAPVTLHEYPTSMELQNRSVTIMGTREDTNLYVDRDGLNRKDWAFGSMNMTHYHNQKPPRTNRISCAQHVARMETETNITGSFYYQKTQIQDLMPKYEFSREKSSYVDTNTNTTMIPWTKERIEQFESEEKLPDFF